MRVKAGIPFLIVTATLSNSSQGAEYSVTPFVDTRVEASSNKRLTAADTDTTFGGTVNLGAAFTAATEASSLSLTPRVSLGRFSDDGNNVDQDREDYFLDSNAAHRFNERLSVGAFLNFANTGVIASELDDLGLVLDTPTSFSRKTISAGPSLTYIFSEKDTLSLGASFTDASYDDNNNTELSDYDRYSINASWTRRLTEQGQLIVSVFTSQQDSELSPLVLNSIGPSPSSLISENKEKGVTIGYIHSFSETLLGRFSIGVRDTENDFPSLDSFNVQLADGRILDSVTADILRQIDPRLFDGSFVRDRVYSQGAADNTGLLLDVGVEKQFELTSMTAGLSRSSQGTGLGLNQERDEFYITADRELSDRLRANSAFTYFSTTLENNQTDNSIDQMRLEAGLNYQMTEYWTLGGGYGYKRISSDNLASQDDHTLFFTVGYNGNKYAISR